MKRDTIVFSTDEKYGKVYLEKLYYFQNEYGAFYIHRVNNNCMKTLSPSFDPTAQSPYDQFLAGQVYNADSQCVQLHGDGSYLCRVNKNTVIL